jgi:bacteriorhodopsin
MAVLPDITYAQYNAVYNALSFGIAGMGAACLFVYVMIPNVLKKYRVALMINVLVTAIATYHYFRIFNSFAAAYTVQESAGPASGAQQPGLPAPGGTAPDPEVYYTVVKSGSAFNDAYRYVDWLLTVPLLLLELILVMGLSEKDTSKLSWQLGIASALMVAAGYPGEISDSQAVRWICWCVAMLFFIFVLYHLLVGLGKAAQGETAETDSDAEEQGLAKNNVYSNKKVQSLIAQARYLTAVSWLTYPFVYMLKSVGLSGAQAMTGEQIGYTVADLVAKAVFGILIWAIASEKSTIEEKAGAAA